MELDTVTIHQIIDGIPREEEVPESTVEGWEAHGWVRGPFPRDEGADDRPPKAGKGSDLQAWVDYAARRDIVLEVGATRADIIAAVEALDLLDAEQIESSHIDGSETSPVGETPTTPTEEG